MITVNSCPLPPRALLQRYADAGDYTDCCRCDIQGAVSQAQFVAAFYTTPVFRLERLILRWMVNKPSTDEDVEGLARNGSDEFAAWTVEDRRDDQLLLCDYRGSTRSWLMTLTQDDDGGTRASLYFGSAILRQRSAASGKKRLGRGFRLLLGFHRIYSRILLRAACARLGKTAV